MANDIPLPVRLTEGVVWITGASSGIGRELARRLLDEGWTVALTARREPELQSLAHLYPRERVLVVPADVIDAAAMAAAAARIEAETGRPIVLAIANAGIWQRMGMNDFDVDAFRNVIAVNVLGTANMLAAVLPSMRARRRGQIAIVASVAGYLGLPRASAYGASKAALIHMASSLRAESAQSGILVQVINPGFVATPMTASSRASQPFVLSAEEAAARIQVGLSATRFEIAFPWPLVLAMKLAKLLPWPIFFRAIRLAPRRN
jgi:NAD(P)-dependent dehydrogenase (short-subunit alcohol dehydrogenase family)